MLAAGSTVQPVLYQLFSVLYLLTAPGNLKQQGPGLIDPGLLLCCIVYLMLLILIKTIGEMQIVYLFFI